MDLKAMKYLTVLAQQRSMNAASSELYISQQALSKCVRNLENELEIKLLERSYQGVQLTSEGQIVVDFCSRVLEEYAQMQEQLRQSQNSIPFALEGKINIYINPLSDNSTIQNKLKALMKSYPKLQMYTMKDDTASILKALRELPESKRAHTLAIINTICADDGTLLPEFALPDGYLYRPISKGAYRACVSKKSPLAKTKLLSMQSILKERIAAATRPDYITQCPIYLLLKRYGEPQITFASNSEEMWLEEIRRNRAVGLLADNALINAQEVVSMYRKEAEAKDIALIEILEKNYLTAICVTSAEAAPGIKTIVDYIFQE